LGRYGVKRLARKYQSESQSTCIVGEISERAAFANRFAGIIPRLNAFRAQNRGWRFVNH
jgi:hypothetical protein